MKHSDFMTATDAVPSAQVTPAAAATAAPAEGEGRMAYLVDRLFALREAFQVAPDPTGNFDSPECRALDAEVWRIEQEILDSPIQCASDVGAYARYLAREAECFDMTPADFAKFIAWADGVGHPGL